jgi:hypothetical protein
MLNLNIQFNNLLKNIFITVKKNIQEGSTTIIFLIWQYILKLAQSHLTINILNYIEITFKLYFHQIDPFKSFIYSETKLK